MRIIDRRGLACGNIAYASMKVLQITKSRKLMILHLIWVSLVAVFLVILSFVLLKSMRNFLGIDITLFGWILRLMIVLVALGAGYATNLQDKNKKYTFKDQKLIISNRYFGLKNTETVFKIAPGLVSNINLKQSISDKILGVGTVSLSIDGYSGKNVYRLAGIDKPKRVVDWLESSLTSVDS